MQRCVKFSWKLKGKKVSNMPKRKVDKQRALGGIHPKDVTIVTVRLGAEEGEKVREAAKNTGRSVAGFVRFAALQLVNEVTSQSV